ncbi:SLATT domain-containing protein [Achromobacter mucicolens]|uniref:SLATT domain-containing protein n=1 Tax=Achromobacter mucicolens TaxID=1389922 RepID=A0ABD4YZ27_9BURK|nr:SLATT domain-containing protein [Achromobacter mucicolens]MDH1180099.1 SLATT domain-containing protein [Achromobacter mucicolens]
MDQRIQEIVAECRRQEDSCRYTSTALYEWMKAVRIWRIVFIVVPIVAGSFASARILLRDPTYDWAIAISSLIAGLFPAIFKALELDVSLKTISDSAHRFKVLQDRFRQAANIFSTGEATELDEEFKGLMERMDDARSASPAIPDRYFKRAQKKIKGGAYDFDVDQKPPPPP